MLQPVVKTEWANAKVVALKYTTWIVDGGIVYAYRFLIHSKSLIPYVDIMLDVF